MARETKFLLPKQEQFYFDEVTNSYKPVVKDEGMLPVQSIQKKWKDDFSKTTFNTDKWEIVKQGTGQTIDASIAGDCRINTGTTADAETIILSKEYFTIPMRGLFGFQISQKIANQEFYLEFVSVDKATGIPDGKSKVAWKISGTDSTTNTIAKTVTQAGGMTPVESGTLTVNVAQTSSGIYELELFSDEVWYHTRSMDSTAGRAYSSVRHNNIPDPNGFYKAQIRVKNGSTAPASNTMLQMFFVNVVDYAELTAEITAGRGGASAGQSIATNITGGTISLSAMPTPANSLPTTNNATLTAGNTYTSANLDFGSSTLGQQRVRIMVMHQAGNGHGHLVIDYSTDGTTWREGFREPVASDGLFKTFEFPVLQRYSRIRFINSSTITQTAFYISYISSKMDGAFIQDRHQIFPDYNGSMTASQAYSSTAIDVGGNNKYKKRITTIFADQAGTYFIEVSKDASAWRTVATGTVTANTLFTHTSDILYRYQRVRYTNTATASTMTEINTILSEN